MAWSDEKPAVLKLPVEPIAIYDNIGRELAKTAGPIELSSAPLTIVLTDEAAAKLALDPPPTKPSWLDGKPSPVVLQCLLPKHRVQLKKSAYRMPRGKAEKVPIYVYNFGDKPADVKLALKGPESWKPALAESVRVAPGDRVKLPLSLEAPQSAEQIETLAIEADCGPAGKAVLSMRFLPE